MTTLRLATRSSPLALWQAEYVSQRITETDPTVSVELVTTSTLGDRDLRSPISELGGKGAFSSEVQRVVSDGEADLAVHSAKDLQSVSPEGLTIAAFPKRGDARDALVGCRLANLRRGATVATGSPRRRVQLQAVRPDLTIAELRGNIATRLEKSHNFDAIVMAHVALVRLDAAPDVVDVLSPDVMIPQVGQGALAVECRSDDDRTVEILSALDHAETRRLVEAERRFLAVLGGDCDLPAAAHAVTTGTGDIALAGLLASDAGTLVRAELTGADADVGARLADRLTHELAEQPDPT